MRSPPERLWQVYQQTTGPITVETWHEVNKLAHLDDEVTARIDEREVHEEGPCMASVCSTSR